jgi:hypothetical protein
LNSVTARPIPGTHAQKVILVALELLHEPPATTVTLGDALAAAVEPAGEPDEDEALLHPASSEKATAATTAVMTLTLGLINGVGTRGRCRNRVLDDILAGLLCSVWPCFVCVAALLSGRLRRRAPDP